MVLSQLLSFTLQCESSHKGHARKWIWLYPTKASFIEICSSWPVTHNVLTPAIKRGIRPNKANILKSLTLASKFREGNIDRRNILRQVRPNFKESQATQSQV